tara:strand:- start:464 stop:661 length:198 start_codon:yes stop_codon:yes gene_type:complete
MTLKEQKQKYVELELETCFDDTKYINEILCNHFYKMVRYLNKDQFKNYLDELGWDYEDFTTTIGE